MVLTWVSSGSCELHAQTEQMENEFRGAHHRVMGKHAVNMGLPGRNEGPWELKAPFFPGKVRPVWFLGLSPQCSAHLRGWTGGWPWEPRG